MCRVVVFLDKRLGKYNYYWEICSIEHFTVYAMVKANSIKAWVLAARPKTLTGALIPVILALAWAYSQQMLHNITAALCCILFAAGMQVAANLINDLYDYLKGTDREDRLGPERACAQGWITPDAMRWGIAISIVVSCIFGLVALAVTWQQMPWHGVELVALGVFCVVFAFLYTTRLSYLGWGDVLVLMFFGFVPVCGTYYLQTFTVDGGSILLSLISGVAIDALLVINNYRDRDQDRISGKKTIIVRGGERFGNLLYLSIGFVVAVLIMTLFIMYTDQLMTLLCAGVVCCIYLCLHISTWGQMVKIREGKALNKILGLTSRNMFLMAVFVAVVLVML